MHCNLFLQIIQIQFSAYTLFILAVNAKQIFFSPLLLHCLERLLVSGNILDPLYPPEVTNRRTFLAAGKIKGIPILWKLKQFVVYLNRLIIMDFLRVSTN